MAIQLGREQTFAHIVEVANTQLAHEANTLMCQGWELLSVTTFERTATYVLGRPRYVEKVENG